MNNVEILLVEDSESDAEMTIRALKKNNLANNLFRVADGAAALDFLYSQGEYASRKDEKLPKVILLDLKMPRLNGMQVLEKLRTDERTKRIPIVILTSSKEDPDIKKCYDLGVNSYVVKPVAFDDFQKAISNIGLYWLIVNNPQQ